MTGSAGHPQRLAETNEPNWPNVAALLNALYAHAQYQTAQLSRMRRHLGQIDERLSALESEPIESSDALAELCAELLDDAGDEASGAG